MSENNKALIYTSAPHRRTYESTSVIMRDVVFALVPVIIFGCVYFGMRMLMILLVSVGSCFVLEGAFELIFRRKISLLDCTFMVTGIMVTLIMPISVPLWIIPAADAIAIIFVKQLPGGTGKNYLNPAAFAKVVLFFLFSKEVGSIFVNGIEVMRPLEYLETEAPELMPSLMSCFLGVVPGNMGETSCLLILLGGIYLTLRRIVDWRIPVSVLVSSLVISLILGRGGLNDILTGGIMLSAFFMAADPVTSPISGISRVIYGALLGVLIIIFRMTPLNLISEYAAVLIMNLVRIVMDRIYTNAGFSDKMLND